MKGKERKDDEEIFLKHFSPNIKCREKLELVVFCLFYSCKIYGKSESIVDLVRFRVGIYIHKYLQIEGQGEIPHG